MSTAQLLARASASGNARLEFMEPDPQLPVSAYPGAEASAPGHPLRLGTQALLELALSLGEQGYRATHLQIVGSNFDENSPPDGVEDIEEHALDLLRAGNRRKLLDYFRGPARGFYVLAIEVRSRRGEGRVTFRRDGWVTVHNSASVGAVKGTLQRTSERAALW